MTDAVYTWVDGNDPAHRSLLRTYSDTLDRSDGRVIGGRVAAQHLPVVRQGLGRRGAAQHVGKGTDWVRIGAFQSRVTS